ncbi:MAG: LapA family protein [Chloroflexi bacterium]|nr:LapA family protein [Chloroflexota bacterium]
MTTSSDPPPPEPPAPPPAPSPPPAAAPPPAPRAPSEPGFIRRHAVLLTGSAFIVGVLIAFILLNSEPVKVNLILGTAEFRLAGALLISAVGGFIIGLLLPPLRRLLRK